MTKDGIEAELKDLKAAVDHFEHVVSALEGAVTRMARGEPIEEIPPVETVKDQAWVCERCGSVLGYYDAKNDILRIRRNDLYIYAHPGAGGWLTMPCRRCGADNVTQDDRPEPPPTEPTTA